MADRPRQAALIPLGSAPLAALKEPNGQVIWAYAERLSPGWQVTLDVDAQLVETAKVSAHRCYQGYRVSQPIEVSWAEAGLVLADEFGYEDVPASKDIE